MVENPLSVYRDGGDDEENPFSIPSELNNLTILVEGTFLYVNADMLKLFSAVFKAMLSDRFKEGQQNKIELPGKKACDVIRLFRFFYHDKDTPITDTCNFYSILSMCEEYELEWVSKKIISYLTDRVSAYDEYSTNMTEKMLFEYRYDSDASVFTRSKNDSLFMYFLLVSERFEIKAVRDECHKYCYELEFYNLKNNEIFNLLSKESQRVIYKYCLMRRLTVEPDILVNDDVYDEVMVNHFDMLMEEKAPKCCQCCCKRKAKEKHSDENNVQKRKKTV